MELVIELKANVVSTAPALPDAAEMPWAVDLTLVGKTSTGMRKVVAEGPQLRKNCLLLVKYGYKISHEHQPVKE